MSTEPTNLDPALLELLRCPACLCEFKPPSATEMECTSCGAVYPIRNGVPILLVDEALRTGSPNEGPSERTGD